MNRRSKSKHIKILAKKVMNVVAFFVFSCAAIAIGTTGGNFLFNMDFFAVQNMDTGLFKSTFDNTIPLIGTVYNNGNAGTSLIGEAESLAGQIFGIDLNNPVTVLNSQSLLMNSYYNNEYKQYLAKNEIQVPDIPQENVEKEQAEEQPKQYQTDASSISYFENEEEDNKENVPERIITKNSISVLNETKYKIDIEELLSEPLKLKISQKSPQILIYHTHTTESYIKSLNDLKKNVDTRNRDPRNNIVRVGEELAQTLKKKYGFGVLHNGTIHDTPDFNSAYAKSLVTINNYLKSYPTIGMTFDIHRDAAGVNQGKLRAVKKVGNKNVAQVMIVVGTDQNGLPNPNWRENLKFALRLQQKLNEICPGLAKPIDLSANRYNMHVTNGSLLFEIGGDGNLLSECIESTKYVAQAINDVVKGK